jgi:hypothetical protein
VEGETGSCSETCIMCDADGTEEVCIKFEEAIDTKGEIPEAVTFSEIKTEREVRLWGFLCGGGSSCFIGHLLKKKRNSEITLHYFLLCVILWVPHRF